jgi:CHAT domain-containing protein
MLGQLLGGTGDRRRAALELERALAIVRSSSGAFEIIQPLRALRQLRVKMGQPQAAMALAEEMLTELESRPADHVKFEEVRLVATDFGQLGDRSRERELRLEVLALARELDDPEYLMEATVQLAEMGLDAGDAEDARPWVERAVALLPDVEDHGWRMDAHVVRARLDELQGDSTSALSNYRKALDEMRQWRPAGRASPLQLEYIRGEHVRVLSLLQRLASTGVGDRALLDEALQLAQESQAIELRGLLAATPGVEKGDASGLAARRQVVAQERTDVQLALASAEGERLEVLRVRLARLEDDEDLLQRRAALRLGRPSPEQLRSLSLDELQASLPQGTALIQQFMGKEQALAFVVRRETAALLDLGESEPIRQAVGFLLEAAGGHAAESVAGGAAQELFERLIRPVQPHIRGAGRLVVVPDDVLHALPLEALTGADDRPFLLELPVTYLPTLAFLRRGAVPRELEAMASLVVGAPALPGSGAADALGAEQRSAYERGGHDLGPLEHAGAEARSVARLVRRQSSRVLTGDEATEADVKAEDLTRYRLLHFATHAIADEQVPLRSALALAPGGGEDGFLEVREILDLDLNADLVVLSACSTGRGRLIRGEGIVGLSRAFLVAGARSLVVSLWNVDDRTTRLLMESFYRNLRKGLAADDALRRAKLALRSRGGGRFAHPYHWAPFVLVGDPDAASFEQPPADRLKAAR